MVDYRTKYGFISNYEETIFLKIDYYMGTEPRVFISNCIHHSDEVTLAGGLPHWSVQPDWLPPPRDESDDKTINTLDHAKEFDGQLQESNDQLREWNGQPEKFNVQPEESKNQQHKSTISVRLALLFLTLQCSSSDQLDWRLSDDLYAHMKPLVGRESVRVPPMGTPDGTSRAGLRRGHDSLRTPPMVDKPTRHCDASAYVPSDDDEVSEGMRTLKFVDDMGDEELDFNLNMDSEELVSQGPENLRPEGGLTSRLSRRNGQAKPGKRVTFADSDTPSNSPDVQ